MKIKFKHYTALFNSFGIVLSRDCVLQQWEPYEVVHHWEPYASIFFAKHHLKIFCQVTVHSWLGKRWGIKRDEQKAF